MLIIAQRCNSLCLSSLYIPAYYYCWMYKKRWPAVGNGILWGYHLDKRDVYSLWSVYIDFYIEILKYWLVIWILDRFEIQYILALYYTFRLSFKNAINYVWQLDNKHWDISLCGFWGQTNYVMLLIRINIYFYCINATCK